MTVATPALSPRRGIAAPVALLASCLAAAATVLVVRAAGSENFATDPVGVASLVGATLSVSVVASRHRSSRALSAWMTAVAVSLALYLVLAAWANVAARSGTSGTEVAARLWSQAWMMPLTLTQVVGLRAVDGSSSATRLAATLTAATALISLVGAAIVDASAPFAGVATIAPGRTSGLTAAVEGAGANLWLLSLLIIPAILAARTRRAASRASIAMATGAAALPVLAVVVCVALAVIRDPGEVDPTVGSVAFLVTLSAACAAGVVVASVAHAIARDPARATRTRVRATAAVVLGGYAVAALIVGGILAAGALRGAGMAAVILVVVLETLAVLVVVSVLANRLVTLLVPEPSAPPPARVLVSALTQRETEVLAALASGSSNVGIATRLVVSERTVDAHVRSIFVKLGLANDPADNRRVRAARLWFEATRDEERTPEGPS